MLITALLNRAHWPLILLVLLTGVTADVHAQTILTGKYNIEATANFGTDNFAPYYLGANRGGRLTQSDGLATEGSVTFSTDTTQRFSIKFGLDLVGSWSSSVNYERYNSNDGKWCSILRHPPRAWIQQLYAEANYRSLFIALGMNDYSSSLLNDRLSSGDLTRSANSRPLPELRVGISDFRKVPFTSGWLEAEGMLSYGKHMDNGWWKNHFNYYTYHISDGQWLVYRRLYLRSDASKRFSVTIGLQAATQFGGSTYYYWNGKHTETRNRPTGFKDFVKVLIPSSKGDEDFLIGNTLGSVDILARYRFPSGSQLRLYLQNPWEDGSGLAKKNGFDGLWGIEFQSSRRGWISGAVIEYLDMTNQSGPLHWAPDYIPGTDIMAEATGADNYYNNYYYNSYANYGMLMGNPLVVSPIYNTDGFPAVLTNRMRAVHLGVEGQPSDCFSYRLLMSYRKSWGSGYIPLIHPLHAFSAMAETRYSPERIKGLNILLQIGLDRGRLPDNTIGTLIGISYSGDFRINR